MREITRISDEDVRALVYRVSQEQDWYPRVLEITRRTRVRAHKGHPTTAHYHASSKDKSTEYCIKLFDTSTPEKRMFFQREVRLLREFSDKKFGQSVAMTPEVHMADVESGVLVMEWLDGSSMKSSLFFANYSADRRDSLLRMSAQWLRNFHEVCGIERKPANAQDLVDGLQTRISAMTSVHHSQLLSDNSVTRGIDLLTKRASAMDETPVEWSLRHGDFTPSNLIVSHKGEVVRGIDFGKAIDSAPVSFDLADFIVRACELGADVMFAETRAGNARLKRSIEVALNGYNEQLSDADRNWMLWCLLYRCATRNVNYFTTGGAINQNIPKRLMSHLKRRNSRRLIRTLCEFV